MKNILFDKPTLKVQANEHIPPIDPVSGLPMVKVICGSYSGKKFHAWFGAKSKLILPIFKTPEA
jgi:hypothetical protein